MKQAKSELLIVAIEAALEAGEILRKGFGTKFQISSKKSKRDVVTEYDKASEACILKVIASQFPDHQFLAEESGHSKDKKGEITWIIDPLDGTENFAHNIPIFSISIAAALEEEVVCGVVFQPMLHELFMAEKGKGAFLNGNKLEVSKTSSLEMSFGATGFPHNLKENPLGCIDQFCSLSKKGAVIRRLGSAAIDLSYVASGRFDAFWEVTLQPWDCAAGILCVEEAGGKVSGFEGKPRSLYSTGPILASNGPLHGTLVKELAQ